MVMKNNMKWDNIKAYIFDLDDTLYEEYSFVVCAFSDVCLYLSKKYNMDYNNLLDFCLESVQRDGRGDTFDRLCEKYSIKENVNELVVMYRKCKPQIKLYEDAKELLSILKKNQIKTGIITDGNASVQENKIKALNLFRCVDTVILTDNIISDKKPLSKPDERVYRICLAKMNVNPEESVYIGDNPLKDFIGARKIGMKTVRIVRDRGMFMNKKALSYEYEADLTIHSLTEIGMYLP